VKLIDITQGNGNAQDNPHPARVEVFPLDWGTVGHVLYGAGCAFIPSPYREAALMAWIGYHLSQHDAGESWARTGGEFIELATGLVIGALIVRSRKGKR
jgi:hypothetical protein